MAALERVHRRGRARTGDPVDLREIEAVRAQRDLQPGDLRVSGSVCGGRRGKRGDRQDDTQDGAPGQDPSARGRSFLLSARDSDRARTAQRAIRDPCRRPCRTSGSSSISATSTAPNANVVGPACVCRHAGARPTMSGRNSISRAPSTAPQIEPKNPTTAPTSR